MPIAKQTVATVIPALQYQDAPAAIDFLCRAFGFEKRAVYEGEGGSIAHAQLTPERVQQKWEPVLRPNALLLLK
jgi:hypothetical protein